MTPQLTNAHPDPQQAAHPDARINHVLEALRTAAPPAGLEQRIAARLAQAAEARQATTPQARPLITTDSAAEPSPFTTILNAVKAPRNLLAPASLYTAAAALALLLTLTTITLLHHHTPPTTAQSKPIPTAPAHSASLSHASTLADTHLSQVSNPDSHLTAATTQVPQAFNLDSHPGLTNTQVPRGFSLGSHSPIIKSAGGLTPAPDPDAIALAETLAPSRAAPPLPLTPQEQLIVSATRPGQPIQLAELDIARAPFLRAAAKARTDAAIQRYVHGLLAPFAAADALQPTTFAEPREISTSAPAPQPPASLSN